MGFRRIKWQYEVFFDFRATRFRAPDSLLTRRREEYFTLILKIGERLTLTGHSALDQDVSAIYPSGL